jgi:hypothetical protein
MASSALTGNTSGLASATSPGLVGIDTQTFAGDKTLSGLITANGGIINTGLTGTNATTVTTSGSGKVGEVIDAGVYTSTTATTTEADVLNAAATGAYQITLTPGVWMIFYSVSAYYSSGIISGNSGYLITCVTDSLNNHIARSERLVVGGATSGTALTGQSSLCASFVLNITTSTTYKMRLKKVDSNGTGIAKVERSSGNYDGNFYAVRIA